MSGQRQILKPIENKAIYSGDFIDFLQRYHNAKAAGKSDDAKWYEEVLQIVTYWPEFRRVEENPLTGQCLYTAVRLYLNGTWTVAIVGVEFDIDAAIIAVVRLASLVTTIQVLKGGGLDFFVSEDVIQIPESKRLILGIKSLLEAEKYNLVVE